MNIYCTYLTTYYGNKLPMFYIGSSTIDRINSGYRGSVQSKEYKKIWNSELSNNPNLFKTVILTTHETRKDALEKERFFHISLNVVPNVLYTNKALSQVNGSHGYPQGFVKPKSKQTIRKIKNSLKLFYDSEEGILLKEKQSVRFSNEGNPQYGKTGESSTCYGRTGELHPMFNRRGADNPNYGRQHTEETRKLISKNHHNVNGSNNPKAIKWLLTSPEGVQYHCFGNLQQTVDSLGLGATSLKKYLNKPVPVTANRHPKSVRTTGWMLQKLS